MMRQSQTVPSLQFHVSSGKVGPGSPVRLGNDLKTNRRSKETGSEPNNPGVKAHVRRQDGRLQAYGWSLPSRPPGTAVSAANPPIKGASPISATVGVPVPVYCRPLEDQEPGMKIWCAAGIDLTGGQTKDGGSMVGSSVFYNPIPPGDSAVTDSDGDAVQSLAAELDESQWERNDAEMAERRLSSLVWIISSATEHAGKSRVNVIDSNRPGDVILTFDIHGANVLSIATVSGVKDNDFGPPPSHDLVPAQEEESPTDDPNVNNGGGIRYVSCSVAGSDPVDQPKDNENEGTAIVVDCLHCLCVVLTVVLRLSSLSAQFVQTESVFGGRYFC